MHTTLIVQQRTTVPDFLNFKWAYPFCIEGNSKVVLRYHGQKNVFFISYFLFSVSS